MKGKFGIICYNLPSFYPPQIPAPSFYLPLQFYLPQFHRPPSILLLRLILEDFRILLNLAGGMMSLCVYLEGSFVEDGPFVRYVGGREVHIPIEDPDKLSYFEI
jgi:hypothetical protein